MGEAACAMLPRGSGNGAASAFDPASAAWAQGGRGGNFALGYVGDTSSSELHSQALECTRRQVEKCYGTCLGVALFHSVGGGSGSGLGVRIAEEFRDIYPDLPLLSCSVLPITSGENPVQSFNALLSLAALQELADGVVLYENDRLMATADVAALRKSAAPGSLGGGTSLVGEGASLAAMNDIIVGDLAPQLCPASITQPLDLGALVATACPMPTHRFLQSFSGESKEQHGPPSSVQPAMEALARATPRMPRAMDGCGAMLAGQAVVRGSHVSQVKKFRTDLLDRLGGAASWQPFALETHCAATPLRSAPTSSRISVLVNWKRVAHVLKPLIARAH